MPRTKRSTDKDKAAKQKVEELLKDSILKEEKKPKDAIETATKEKNVDYLVDSVTQLTKENEELKEDLKKSFDELNKIRNAPDAPADAEELKKGIVKLFIDLENAYLGRNPEKRQYPDASVKILLDKFVGTFQFLQKK